MDGEPSDETEERGDHCISKIFLKKAARKIWYFFETFVEEKENWLPPDNYQEVPNPVVANRTSPTNIGLSLMANLAAYDLDTCRQRG